MYTKSLYFLIAAGLVSGLLAGCTDKEEPDNTPTTVVDESGYAAAATVGSSDGAFTATDGGGTVQFEAEGGQVILDVDCAVDWTAENNATDLFTASVNIGAGTLSITATQNYETQVVSGTLVLRTAATGIEFATITVEQAAYVSPEISVETDSWNFPAVGDLTALIAVDSSLGEFTAESNATWLSVGTEDGIVSVTASENAETSAREAAVTLTAYDGIVRTTAAISVTQDARAYITLSAESVKIAPSAGTVSIAVASNFDWSVTDTGSDSWFVAGRNGDNLTVTVDENGSSERSGSVVVMASDGAENTATATLNFTQTVEADPLVLDYMVTDSDMTVYLPLSGTVDCTVDWGDGCLEYCGSANPSHTYTQTGEYEVSVNGTVTGLSSANVYSGDNPNTTLIAVKSWGKTGLTSMYYAFDYNKMLSSIPDDTLGSFSDVTTFDYAFHYCTSLAEIPAGLFGYCSKVTSFKATFNACKALEAIPAGLFDNCTTAVSFALTFYDCTSLNSIPGRLFVNTKAYDMEWCFYYNLALKTIPADLFAGCSRVTYFFATFYMCNAIEEIPEGLFDDCSAATNFTTVFGDCNALVSIPGNLFDNCPNVTTFENVFYGCRALTSVPTNLFDKNRKVTNFDSAFCNDSYLTGESPYSEIEVNGETVKVHLYERENYPDYFTKPTSTSWCFYLCTGLDDYDNIPSSWIGG